ERPVHDAGGRVEVKLTHPDKVLYPKDGYTKADLAAYYAAVEAPMLAALAGAARDPGRAHVVVAHGLARAARLGDLRSRSRRGQRLRAGDPRRPRAAPPVRSAVDAVVRQDHRQARAARARAASARAHAQRRRRVRAQDR